MQHTYVAICMQHNYVHMRDNYVDTPLNVLYVNIFMLHVNIINIAFRAQRHATIKIGKKSDFAKLCKPICAGHI